MFNFLFPNYYLCILPISKEILPTKCWFRKINLPLFINVTEAETWEILRYRKTNGSTFQNFTKFSFLTLGPIRVKSMRKLSTDKYFIQRNFSRRQKFQKFLSFYWIKFREWETSKISADKFSRMRDIRKFCVIFKKSSNS